MRTKEEIAAARQDVERRLQAHYDDNYNDDFTLKDMRAWSRAQNPLLEELAQIEQEEAAVFWKEWNEQVVREEREHKTKYEAEEQARLAELEENGRAKTAAEQATRSAWRQALNEKRAQMGKRPVNYGE